MARTNAHGMKVHEFQAKQILRDAGVAVLDGMVATTPAEAANAFAKLGGPLAVVKAQIHAGGRGKGKTSRGQAGVALVSSATDAEQVAARLLGEKLVTIQTGPEGQTVRQVLVEAGCDIARELYLGIVLDRAAAMPVLMVSAEGGVEIEQVAAETPEKIHKTHFDPHFGLQSYQVRRLCQSLGISGKAARAADQFAKSLCRVFVELDCSLVEINPLVVTGAGDLVALDAKMTFDDNALFRHAEIASYRDVDEEEPAEVRAGQAGLSYVKLDGNIACLVNGGGTGDEHDGLNQVAWRRTCQLLGRRWWCQCRAGNGSISHYFGRPEREGRAGQHLWRDHALHDNRQGAGRCLQDSGVQCAPGRPS